MASVLYDAVLVAGGRASVDTLRRNGAAIRYVAEAYKHGKAVGAIGEGVDLLREAPLNDARLSDNGLISDAAVVTLAAPDDDLLRAVLVKLFADRQLAVDEPLVGYVVTRIERSFAAARAVVAKLDTEAMQLKRPLTRALAAEILREGP